MLNTFSKLFSMSKIDERIKIVKLSRNFGHQNAIYAGLQNVSGDCVFLIDVEGFGAASVTLSRTPKPGIIW